MNSPSSSSNRLTLASSIDILALLREKTRARAKRYQRGSLTVWRRKTLPDAWMFRYYVEENGRRVYKRKLIGTVIEFPKRKDVEKAIAQLRIEINEGAQSAPLNIEQLVAHYKKEELPRKAYATTVSYTEFLDDRIVPKWGDCALSAIKSIEVEKWLDGLKRRKDGNPRIALEFYQQAVTDEKREAQELAMRGFLGPDFCCEPQNAKAA